MYQLANSCVIVLYPKGDIPKYFNSVVTTIYYQGIIKKRLEMNVLTHILKT